MYVSIQYVCLYGCMHTLMDVCPHFLRKTSKNTFEYTQPRLQSHVKFLHFAASVRLSSTSNIMSKLQKLATFLQPSSLIRINPQHTLWKTFT